MKEYFGIVLRKVQKNKADTINKIAGLTIAMVACLLIAFYVNDEFSYDQFHSKKDRVYRLVKDGERNESGTNPIWPMVMFQHLRDQIPGAEKIVNLSSFGQGVFTANHTPFLEEDIYIADAEVFDVFDFRIMESQSHKDLLVAPNTMLISRKMATKFFPDESPVGKTIKYENMVDLTITGVFENFPDQSHINPQFLISSSTAEQMDNKQWTNQGSKAYILLADQASPEEVAKKIKEAVIHAAKDSEWLFTETKFSLQPLTDIHLLSSGFHWDSAKKGNIDFVRMILMIGILILLVAGANHINLTITQSMTETKQFAVMKTMGGSPHQVRLYIYTEIFLNVVISVVLAAFITLMILPIFGNLVEKQFMLGLQTYLRMAFLLIAIVVTLTFITAVYPAFLFSRIPVMRIFQNSYKIGGENIRKGLIIFQFAISAILIASAIFMYQQMQLLTSTKLGFDKEQLLVINNPGSFLGTTTTQYERFKNLVDKLPTVESIGCARNAPAGNINETGEIKSRGATDKEAHPCRIILSFDNLLPTIRAHFLAGTDFTESKTSKQLVMSRKIVEELDETPESIIGKEYAIKYRTDGARVVGVVDDVQYYPHLKKDEQNSAVVFWNTSRSAAAASIIVRTSTGDWRNTVTQLEKAWKEAVPEWPFTYELMDERLARSYKKELTDIRTITIFSIVAIILSCFGVMGISHYTARKRTKEIAIRKVNGANKKDIMILLNTNFMVLNVIAFLVAIPVVVLFLNHWLQSFSYKTNLSWWVFVLAGLATSLIVFLTVSWQSWRAATTNPAKVLKSEA